MPDERVHFVEGRLTRVCENCGETVEQRFDLYWNETLQQFEVVKTCVCTTTDDTGDPYAVTAKVDLSIEAEP